MPLCFGASGSVRARQTPQCALSARRRPHLLPGEPPTTFGANSFRAQRGQVRSGARLGEQLAPEHVTAQRGRHELLDLLGAAVLEDGRRRPPADHQIGPRHTGRGQLLVDQQLLGRPRLTAVRPRPVRRQQPRVGQRGLPLLGRQRGDFGDRGGDFGPQVRHRLQIDVQLAADSLLRQRRDAAQPASRRRGTARCRMRGADTDARRAPR